MGTTKLQTSKLTSQTKVSVKKRFTFMKALKNHWQLYLLFCLPLLYVIVFKYVPMYGAIIAFKNFDPTLGIWGSPWVGLDNFIKFIHSYEFGRVLKNTLLLSLYHLIAGFPFPIILALSLNYVYRKRFKKFAQMITYAPHFISVVVIVGIILLFLSPRGPFSQVLSLFGVHNVDIMGEPSLFKSIYVWSDIWQNVGFGCIIYLAALTGVSPSLHEAAIIDGASILKRIWHIDIPGILPTTIILLILNMGSILDTGFQKVLLLQNSLNLSSSEVIDTFVYKVGLVAPIPQYSYAAAIGFFKAAIAFVLIIGANRLARKVGQESLW